MLGDRGYWSGCSTNETLVSYPFFPPSSKFAECHVCQSIKLCLTTGAKATVNSPLKPSTK